MNGPHRQTRRRRLLLSFVAPAHLLLLLLLATPISFVAARADASTAPLSSAAHRASSPTESGHRKKKRRRRRRRREDLPLSSSELLPNSTNDRLRAVKLDGPLTEDDSTASSASASERESDVICSSPIGATSGSDAEESLPIVKRKKKRRRRVVPRVESIGEGILQDGVEVLLPIDGDANDGVEVLLPIDDDDDGVSSEEAPNDLAIHEEDDSAPENHSLGDESIGGSEDSLMDSEMLLDCYRDDESSSLNVTRNETTETMTIRDDADADDPATYEYTKRNEEETTERLVRLDDSFDEASSGSADAGRTAFVQSSRQREDIQLKGGGAGKTVSVAISRQRKEHRVRIANDGESAKKKRRAVATRGAAGKGGECLRRVRREWKDAVAAGIAYDWANARSVSGRTRRSSSDANDDKTSSSNDAHVRIGPLGKNLLRWHFSVSGPPSSVYESGIYHGRVLLPRDYPGSPPRVQVLTPSGRFRIGADICLSASSYHPETWTPRWTVAALVDALRIHMLTTANELGGVEASAERRRALAEESRGWRGATANHGRMVAVEGLFPLPRKEEEDATNGGNGCDVVEASPSIADPAEALGNVGEGESPGIASPARSQSNSVDDTAEHPSASRIDAKAAKSREKSRRGPRRKGPTKKSKAAKAQTAQKAVAAEDVASLTSKRIIVEMLKLPLRILAVLLRALTGLEARLRSILDGL